MVVQNPATSFDPRKTIGAQIKESLLAHRVVPKAAARERIISLLGDVGLSSPVKVAKSRPHQLSGGMAQREREP